MHIARLYFTAPIYLLKKNKRYIYSVNFAHLQILAQHIFSVMTPAHVLQGSCLHYSLCDKPTSWLGSLSSRTGEQKNRLTGPRAEIKGASKEGKDEILKLDPSSL